VKLRETKTKKRETAMNNTVDVSNVSSQVLFAVAKLQQEIEDKRNQLTGLLGVTAPNGATVKRGPGRPSGSGRGPGRPPGTGNTAAGAPRKTRNLSPEARERIRNAQLARWAKVKKQ
jgi:hypothetical protein